MRPIQHSSDDLVHVRRALSLAREMRGRVWPNPPVGCVIVKDGRAIAEAATQPGGRPHAERKALDLAGAEAEGATLYVTLEPCCHWGKTPPCADAIITAGVSRVVCCMQDPDPRVNGGGFAKLRHHGVEVDVGICAADAQRVMSGFLHRIHYGEPEIVLVDGVRSAPSHQVDAIVHSSEDGLRVVSQFGDVQIANVEQHELRRELGRVGLTSVAILSNDPLSAILGKLEQDAPSWYLCDL